MTAKVSRKCQKCDQEDITEFSTCRFCKTRYVGKGKAVTVKDTRRTEGPPSSSTAVMLVIILLLVAFAAYHFVTHSGRAMFQSLTSSQSSAPVTRRSGRHH